MTQLLEQEEAWQDPPLEPPKGTCPGWCLDFVPLPSTAMREDSFVVLSHQFVAICDGTPRKLIYSLN